MERRRERVRGLERVVRAQRRAMKAMASELDVVWEGVGRKEREEQGRWMAEVEAGWGVSVERERTGRRMRTGPGTAEASTAASDGLSRMLEQVLQHVHSSGVHAQGYVEEIKRLHATVSSAAE